MRSWQVVFTQNSTKFWATYQWEETEIMMLEMAGCFMNNTSSSSGQVRTGVWPPPWNHHGRHRSKLQACPCEITWLWPTVWMKFRRRSRFYWPRSGWANLHFTGKSRMTVDGELTSHFNFTLKNKHSGASGLIKCKLFLLNVVFRPVCVSVAWTLTIKTLIRAYRAVGISSHRCIWLRTMATPTRL